MPLLPPTCKMAIWSCFDFFFFCIKKALHGFIPLLSFPAVRSSMPDFYERMKNWLRTEAQGADTVLWLAVSAEATKLPSGLFFQGEEQCLTGHTLEIPSLPELRIPVWPGRGWRLHQAACAEDKAFLKVVSSLSVGVNIVLNRYIPAFVL